MHPPEQVAEHPRGAAEGPGENRVAAKAVLSAADLRARQAGALRLDLASYALSVRGRARFGGAPIP